MRPPQSASQIFVAKFNLYLIFVVDFPGINDPFVGGFDYPIGFVAGFTSIGFVV